MQLSTTISASDSERKTNLASAGRRSVFEFSVTEDRNSLASKLEISWQAFRKSIREFEDVEIGLKLQISARAAEKYQQLWSLQGSTGSAIGNPQMEGLWLKLRPGQLFPQAIIELALDFSRPFSSSIEVPEELLDQVRTYCEFFDDGAIVRVDFLPRGRLSLADGTSPEQLLHATICDLLRFLGSILEDHVVRVHSDFKIEIDGCIPSLEDDSLKKLILILALLGSEFDPVEFCQLYGLGTETVSSDTHRHLRRLKRVLPNMNWTGRDSKRLIGLEIHLDCDAGALKKRISGLPPKKASLKSLPKSTPSLG